MSGRPHSAACSKRPVLVQFACHREPPRSGAWRSSSGLLRRFRFSQWTNCTTTQTALRPCVRCPPVAPLNPFFAAPGMNHNIRNIAIIAHVDHGKTTLVDELLKGRRRLPRQPAGGGTRDGYHGSRAREGITIKAKNASIHWRGKTINLVDTPAMPTSAAKWSVRSRWSTGASLLVDAYDGPQAQTRFVLRKALQHGLKVIIVVNKIDRENSDPAGTYESLRTPA